MNVKQTELQHALGPEWRVWASAGGDETYASNVEQTSLAYSVGKSSEILLSLTNDELMEFSIDSIQRALNSVWAENRSSLLAKYLP
jgi:hypothetical protein